MVKIWTGDECGLIKEYDDVSHKVRLVNAVQEMDRSNGVVGMVRLQDDNRVAAQLWNGDVHVYNSEKRRREKVVSCSRFFGDHSVNSTNAKEHHHLGIHVIGEEGVDSLCSVRTDGAVAIVRDAMCDDGDMVVRTFSTFPSSSPVRVAAHAATRTTLALGGKDRDMAVWDIATEQQLWKAKNLPPHPQTLLQPRVFPSAACFSTETVLAVGTAYHDIRIYDVRAQQRRPTAHTTVLHRPYRISSILSSSDNHKLLIGDAAGYAYQMDLRKLVSVGEEGRFVGPRGSIRSMAATTSKVFVAGLDRHLHMYDASTRKSTGPPLYLKQRLNCILVVQEKEEEEAEPVVASLDSKDKVEDYVDSSSGDEDEQSSVEGVLDSASSSEGDENDSEDEPTASEIRRKRQRSS